MSKTIWLFSVSILSLFAVAASFNSGVSGTIAGLRLDLSQQMSLPEFQHIADVTSAPKIGSAGGRW